MGFALLLVLGVVPLLVIGVAGYSWNNFRGRRESLTGAAAATLGRVAVSLEDPRAAGRREAETLDRARFELTRRAAPAQTRSAAGLDSLADQIRNVQSADQALRLTFRETWTAGCDGCGARATSPLREEAIGRARRMHEHLTLAEPSATYRIDSPIWLTGEAPPALASGTASSSTRPGLAVGRVKEEIGRLRTDIVWVIEHPAFFDVDSPASARFFEALAEWDDLRASRSPAELEAAAERVGVLFESARQYAEKVGLDHLHGQTRRTVETASRLVRKAESTSSEQERRALMGKAAQLLAGIMDVVIPAATLAEIERRSEPRPVAPTVEPDPRQPT